MHNGDHSVHGCRQLAEGPTVSCEMQHKQVVPIIKTHVHGFFDTDLHEVSWTLQPTRLLCWVGYKFNQESEDQCQRNNSKWVFVFVPHFLRKYGDLIHSKWFSKSWLSSTIAMTDHCFDASSQVRAIRRFVIGQERDQLWPDWLTGGCGREFQTPNVQNKKIPHTLKCWNSWASVW